MSGWSPPDPARRDEHEAKPVEHETLEEMRSAPRRRGFIVTRPDGTQPRLVTEVLY